jgi:hypothetical protein
MKKLVVGLGIGCLVLVLAGVGMVVAGGYWAKQKLGGVTASIKSSAEAQQRAQKQFAKLDAKYPFTPPAKGQLLKLDEPRVQAYLGIRQSLLPVYDQFSAQAKSLDKKYKDNKPGSVTEGIAAANDAIKLYTDLVAKVRDTYAAQLDAHQMSPREFHFITATIYRSQVSQGLGQMEQTQRASLPKTIAVLEQQKSAATDDEQKQALQQQIDELKEQLASLPPEGQAKADQAVVDANNALIAKYKADIEKNANIGLDGLLMGSNKDMNEAWTNAFGGQQQNPPAGNDDHDL